MVSSSTKQILLVEGEADRAFFELICKDLDLGTVTVATPKNLDAWKNTKEGVFNHLPVLLKLLPDGRTSQLAAVVDADSAVNGGGFAQVIQRVTNIVEPFGFAQANHPSGGIVFRHNDGLADFGLWVMPNNSDEGMLEDWIKGCIQPDEQALFNHAEDTVAGLPQPQKFKEIHRTKAEVATWLAWQEHPGHGSYRAVEDGLISKNGPPYQNLAAWLGHIYC